MRYTVLLIALSFVGCRTSGLRLGEESVNARDFRGEEDSRWSTVVGEVASMEGRVDGVERVVVAANSVTVHFVNFDPLSIARVARVFAAAASETQITAPDPALVAAAMTSGGYQAERIRELLKGERVILRVTRATKPSARS